MRKLFIIGFMASGKSTVGKGLAARIGYGFVDLDTAIEQREGVSVSQLFTLGEAVFREKESLALQDFAEKTAGNCVISVGGGTPCVGNNLAYMQQNGTVIFLDVDEDILEKRLSQSQTERPMLKQNDWRALLHHRRPIYQKADYTITNNGTPQEAIEKIIDIIKQKTI